VYAHEEDALQIAVQRGLWWPLHRAFAREQLLNARRKFVQSAAAYESLMDVEVLDDEDV
jgi:hypothetical protein